MITCMWCGRTETDELQLATILAFKKIKKQYRCRKCTEKLVRLRKKPFCRGCSREWPQNGLCEDCQKWQQLYPDYSFQHTALYQYNSFMKEWMEVFKYKGDYRAGLLFSREIENSLKKKENRSKIIIPIPVSKASRALRGFDQVEALLHFADVDYLPALLNRSTGKKQSAKNRKQRMETGQPFLLKECCCERIKKRKLILVDDVYTTGRTLFHAAELLLSHGAAGIQTFSVTR